MKLLIAPAAALAVLAAASPAAAQSANEKINMVIAYDASECPVAQPGEVVICEILVEADRYRIPSNLRYSDNPANRSHARLVDEIKYVGDFGTMSCSPAGAGASPAAPRSSSRPGRRIAARPIRSASAC